MFTNNPFSACPIHFYYNTVDKEMKNVTGQNTLLDLFDFFADWLALAKVTFFYNALKLLLSILCHQILMLKTQVQEWIFFSLSIPWQIILVYNRITNMSRLEMSYKGKTIYFIYTFSLSLSEPGLSWNGHFGRIILTSWFYP